MTDKPYPHLEVRVVDGVAVARLTDADILFEQEAVTAIGNELHDLVVNQGHARLVLDLVGVRYMTSTMLAKLVSLDQRTRNAGGRLRLCRVGPTVHDIIAVTHLDRVFEIEADERAALARFPKEPDDGLT